MKGDGRLIWFIMTLVLVAAVVAILLMLTTGKLKLAEESEKTPYAMCVQTMKEQGSSLDEIQDTCCLGRGEECRAEVAQYYSQITT